MAFEKVETQGVDFPTLERRVLQFWNDEQIFEKLKAKNANGQPWSFLDGPITANNPMGVHHAWGRTYKDVYNRYFAMTGRQLRYQQGFDCQGLWVEVEVEKELGLKSKRDIENLVPGDRDASIAKFVQACKDRVDKFARIQTEQSIRLGMWMNWDVTDEDWKKSPDERKSYFTMSEENNYTIWAFLKRCFEKKRIYRGYDVMPWCGRCGVGLSEMEMKEGYKLVEHRAAFVKLPLKNRPNENLLVWTTTPWTLTSNVGAAVNPELTYLAVKLKGETYYVAKGVFKQNRMESSGGTDDEVSGDAKRSSKRDWLEGVPHLKTIEQLFKEKAGKDGFTIEGEVKGETLLGWEYEGPFDDLPAQNHNYGFPEEVASIVKQNGWCPCVTGAKAHRVVSGGKDVTEGEGTGIVHTAPGCGGIDFQWGKANGLPPVAPLDESGTFLDGFGPLAGKIAYDPATADVVFEELKKKDRLFATERYVHRYPHCWRCKTELLYRLVDEWFIDMGPRETEQGFRGEIMKVVEKVTFLPESLNGRARERQWLWQMGDWMISKKRFWGLALPIWVDEKDPTQFEVIGSKEELKKRAVEGWQDFEGNTPHRPYVDKIKICNPKTGNLMSRVPDVGNPWLDAGIVAFSTMKWNTDRDYWKKWYPADFITESFPGQFRNWFYALLALSTEMGEGAPPFKTLLGFATVKDQFGQDMHKSAGNSIEFISAADIGGTTPDAKGNPTAFTAIGADVMRWLYCRQNPASNLNFGPMPANEVRKNIHIKLWNCYDGFFLKYSRLDGYDPNAPQVPIGERADIDRWILSDLQQLIKTSREAYERYDVMAFCLAAEEFIDAKLSNWYIRRNRDRFWSANEKLNEAEKKDKLAGYQTLHTVLRDVTKMIAPVMPFLAETMWANLSNGETESVHISEFPTPQAHLIDDDISVEMNAVLRIVSLGLSARKTKVRQPFASFAIFTANETERRVVSRFAELISDELNVKRVSLSEAPLLGAMTKLNKKTAAAKLGPNLKRAESELAALDPCNLSGGITLAGVELEAEDYSVDYIAPEGYSGIADKGTQVVFDTRITAELKTEGMARDIVRLVQDARKKVELDVADKIALYLGASGELAAAIETHKATIAGETQAIDWLTSPPEGGHSATVKVDGQSLVIGLKKV